MAGGGAVTSASIHDEWIRKYRTRTDLALEAREVIVKQEGPPEIPGVAVHTEETPVGLISRVTITTEEGSRAMGKMPGRYTTIEAPALRRRDHAVLEQVAAMIGREVRAYLEQLQVPVDGQAIVVGLGNWNATPDALGPRTIHHLVVTRHFYFTAPPDGRRGMRPVAGLSPGVLGITGLETAEIVQGLVRQVQPAVVICIDALAARSTERLLTTVQISDAGIQPGSGVGNKRSASPVKRWACPCWPWACRRWCTRPPWWATDSSSSRPTGRVRGQRHAPNAAWRPGPPPGAGGPPPVLPPAVKREVVEQVLEPFMGDLIMTPKEIDVLVEDVAETLAEGLNGGLHDDLDLNRLILSAIGGG